MESKESKEIIQCQTLEVCSSQPLIDLVLPLPVFM